MKLAHSIDQGTGLVNGLLQILFGPEVNSEIYFSQLPPSLTKSISTDSSLDFSRMCITLWFCHYPVVNCL